MGIGARAWRQAFVRTDDPGAGASRERILTPPQHVGASANVDRLTRAGYATAAAATASRSARSLSTLCACSGPVSCPRTQCQRTEPARSISADRAWIRSAFLTDWPAAVL